MREPDENNFASDDIKDYLDEEKFELEFDKELANMYFFFISRCSCLI